MTPAMDSISAHQRPSSSRPTRIGIDSAVTVSLGPFAFMTSPAGPSVVQCIAIHSLASQPERVGQLRERLATRLLVLSLRCLRCNDIPKLILDQRAHRGSTLSSERLHGL